MAKKLRHNGRIDDSVSVYTEKSGEKDAKKRKNEGLRDPQSDIGGRYKNEERNSVGGIIIIMQHTGK